MNEKTWVESDSYYLRFNQVDWLSGFLLISFNKETRRCLTIPLVRLAHRSLKHRRRWELNLKRIISLIISHLVR